MPVKIPHHQLHADPTLSGLLRRKFIAEMNRRFRTFEKELTRVVRDNDDFALGKNNGRTVNARFDFLDDPAKVNAFRQLIQQQSGLITGQPKGDEEWWDDYIQQAYIKGQGRAFEQSKAQMNDQDKLDFYEGSKKDFLTSSFGKPASQRKVKLLAGRVFSQLSGVTASMETELTEIFTDGMINGESPAKISKNIQTRMKKLSKRAHTLARTEITRAHGEGQLQSLEDLGVTEVGVMVEWSTAGDSRVCSKCKPMEGVVFKVEEAYGLIPRHPNCRCAFIPANVGESTQGQKRKITEAKKAIQASVKAEIPVISGMAEKQAKKLTIQETAGEMSSRNYELEKVLDYDLKRKLAKYEVTNPEGQRVEMTSRDIQKVLTTEQPIRSVERQAELTTWKGPDTKITKRPKPAVTAEEAIQKEASRKKGGKATKPTQGAGNLAKKSSKLFTRKNKLKKPIVRTLMNRYEKAFKSSKREGKAAKLQHIIDLMYSEGVVLQGKGVNAVWVDRKYPDQKTPASTR